MVEAAAGLLVGVCAGAVTPLVAARFGDRAAAGWAVGSLGGSGSGSVAGAGWRDASWVWALVGGAAGAVLGWRLDAPAPVLVAWLVVLAAGVPLAAIDLAVHRLPDVLVLPAFALVAVLAATSASPSAVLGGAALATGYALLAVLPGSGLGFGDVKLAAPLGTVLTMLGWWPLVLGTVYAFVLGGVVAVALLVTGRASRDTHIPFGPAMLAGAWLAVLS